MLHLNIIDSNFKVSFSTNFNTNVAQISSIGRFSFLPTIILPLFSGKSSQYRVRTLLDSGAGHSWIASAVLEHINYTSMPSQRLTIGTLNGSVKRKCKMVQVYFHTHTLVPIECFVLDDFVEHIMVKGIKQYLQQKSNLKQGIINNIVDPADNNVDHANLSKGTALVLSNAATTLLCPRESMKINLQEHRLILEPTIFGMAISGQIPLALRPTTTIVQALCTIPKIHEKNGIVKDYHANTHSELGYQREVLEDEIKLLWDKETLGIFIHEVHDDDAIAIRRLEESMIQLESGQFEVKLPFNAKLPLLKSNRTLAVARTYRQLAEMNSKEQYRNLAVKAMKELVEDDYIEMVTEDLVDGRKVHYLPWRGIMKSDSATTKLRIVMDASAKTSASEVSLNQCLYQGPNLILNLAKCLMRFMVNKYRCVADIEKAFLRILIALEDRDVLRFFWPVDPCNPNSKLQEYRWKAVLFGSISSPFILASVLKKLITDGSTSQYTREALLNGIYVDNLFHSDNDEDRLVEFFKEARSIMSKGNFNLREWGSNSKKVRDQASKSNVLVKDSKLGALGLWWSQLEDKFTFKINFSWNQKHTKRSVLSFTNGVFDPLNWLCPLHIQNRIFIRTLWAKKYLWDMSFEKEEELVERWSYLREQCFSAVGLEMDLDIQISDSTEVHVFADASTQAYGAVLYLVTPKSPLFPTGRVRLLKAKGKITPLHKVPREDTMPRWELASILVASNITTFTLDAVPQLRDKELFIWNDSKAALSWCTQVEIKDTYVHNRVTNIRERCPTATIKYVPSAENPADIITRDITAKDLHQCRLWWKAPEWIVDRELWPTTEERYNLHPQIVPQHSNIVGPDQEAPRRQDTQAFHMFSDHRFNKSLRTVAWLLRWKENKTGTRKYFTDHITADELNETKTKCIKIMQQKAFKEQLKDLQNNKQIKQGKYAKLRLFLDNNGVIRCQSRVQFTMLKDERNAPVLMDVENNFTLAYIRNIHVRNNCATYNFLINTIRQEAYGFKLSVHIKRVISKCRICARYRAHPYRYPQQPVLPLQRAMVDKPFAATGVDYAGPFIVKSGDNDKKVWLCLFTCLMSRAIYLVVIEDLKSTTFLEALKELAARRSQPKLLISDNATTFVHASKILAYISTQANVQQQLTSLGVTWKFTPAKASWQGGIYERLIAILKLNMAKMLGNALFTLQDFRNQIISVEAVINNRPLCRVTDQEIITPNHILNASGTIQGVNLSDPLSEQVLEDIFRARKQLPAIYNQLKDRQETFWQALQSQYLETLKFTKDKMGNSFTTRAKVGDVCLIYSDQPRLKWKLAVIMQLIESKDKEHRQAVIRTENGTTTRSLNHLYPLELEVEDLRDQALVSQQLARAKVHEQPLKELRTKMKQTAIQNKQPEEDISNIIDKLDQELDQTQHISHRPRRDAAVKAAMMRQQMIRDNAI